MTDADKMVMLKTLIAPIPDDVTDDLLSVVLTIAGLEILKRAYPYDDTVAVVPTKYEVLQVQIAEALYDKRGASGQVGHNENGTSRSWMTDGIPLSLINQIVPFCGIVGGTV